jgi:SAM-dependent methyltransferase
LRSRRAHRRRELFTDHFSELAHEYASRRPRYPEELFGYLGSVCRGHELAWDCAAGTGQATIPLTRHFRRVVATDASEAMLAQAPPHLGVQYRVAPAGSSGMANASADLVTVAQALHWLDLDEFYREVHRVLVPGGILAVWTYGAQVTDSDTLNRLLQTFYTDVVGPYWAPERRHVEAGYRTLPFPYPELASPRFTMAEEWTLGELLGYVGTWSATQSFRRANHRDPVEDLAGHLMPCWGDPSVARPIHWPLSLRLGAKST